MSLQSVDASLLLAGVAASSSQGAETGAHRSIAVPEEPASRHSGLKNILTDRLYQENIHSGDFPGSLPSSPASFIVDREVNNGSR